MRDKIIGRVAATEKNPTTTDKFTFWTDPNFQLSLFDIVKVSHIDGSFTFGAVKSISHITDSGSFLTNYISSDFGNPEIETPTIRAGMNYAEASVSFNTRNIYTPVHNNAAVYLASGHEIMQALGLDRIQNPLICGSLTMYNGTEDELTLPVNINSDFILGPEGAHLNISGISGLAAKTSFAMFIMKAVQERFIKLHNEEDSRSTALVIFNVKGRDLMAIHRPNDFLDDSERAKYKALGLSATPFRNVKYYIPYCNSSYLSRESIEEYIRCSQLMKFKYCYESDRESLEMLFADIDDPLQTMDSIINKILDDSDSDFKDIKTWNDLIAKLSEFSQKSSGKSSEITVHSWRKFKRIINRAVNNDSMFAQRVIHQEHECRLADELKQIHANDVKVIDIAKLSEDKQAFVFGDALRTIYNLKLGEYDNESGVNPPSKIIIFVDELNKYASRDTPKNSPLLRALLDICERGRSLGVILFGAEQFRSAVHQRITGNCAVHAYGRTHTIEISNRDYNNFPESYKNILTRLEQGEYLIQSPVFRTLLRINFPKPVYKQFKD